MGVSRPAELNIDAPGLGLYPNSGTIDNNTKMPKPFLTTVICVSVHALTAEHAPKFLGFGYAQFPL
jgi:hypothetical protein